MRTAASPACACATVAAPCRCDGGRVERFCPSSSSPCPVMCTRFPCVFACCCGDALPFCALPTSGRYEILKPIGCGAYGAVYLARDPYTGQKVALKHIINAFTSITDARRIFREIKVMKHFMHPNIVKLLHVVRPANTRTFEHIYLVSELMETDLHRVVHSRQDLTSDHISYFLYQVCVTPAFPPLRRPW